MVVYFPLGQYLEEEDTDRAELALPGDQLQLLKDAIYYSESLTFYYSQSLTGSSVTLNDLERRNGRYIALLH